MSATPQLQQHLNGLGHRREGRIGELFDVVHYDRDHHLFTTRDGRVGRIWRIDPYLGESISDEARESASAIWANILNQAPVGADMQILQITHNHVAPSLERFATRRLDDAWSHHVVQSLIKRQLDGSRTGFFTELSDTVITKAMESSVGDEDHDDVEFRIQSSMRSGRFALFRELYLTVWIPARPKSSSFIRLYRQALGQSLGAKSHQRSLARRLEDIMATIKRIETALQFGKLDARGLTGQGLIDVLYREFCPNRARRIPSPRLKRDRPLLSVLEDPDTHLGSGARSLLDRALPTHIELVPQGWAVDDDVIEVVSALDSPQATLPDQLSGALAEEGADGPGWTVINLHVPDQGRLHLSAKLRRNALLTDNEGEGNPLMRFAMGMSGEQLQQRDNDLRAVLEMTDANAQAPVLLVRATLHRLIRHPQGEDARQVIEGAERALWNQGFHERIRGDAAIAHAMPGNGRFISATTLGRDWPAPVTTIADLVPAFDRYQGSGSPFLMVNNARGQPIFLDPWFRREVPAGHAMVVGGTGSGKSFFTLNMINMMQAKEPVHVFYIDKNRSAQPYCEARGGQYVPLVIDREGGITPQPINPLHIPLDEDGRPRTDLVDADGQPITAPNNRDLQFMTDVLVAMLMTGDADAKVGQLDQVLLHRGLKALFAGIGKEREVILSDYLALLRKGDGFEAHELPRIREMATRLEMYSKEGPYGALFDAPLAVDWSNPLIVVETDRLSSSPAFPVAMMVLLYHFEQNAKYRLPDSHKKLMVIDEAWSVLAIPALALAVGGFFRELRKVSGAVWLISQSLADFVKLTDAENSAGNKADDDGIKANTLHFFLLAVKPADRQLAKRYLDLTNEEVDAWGNVANLPPFYSELMYLQTNAQNRRVGGVIRLMSSPETIWTATSHGHERQHRDSLQKRFMQEQGLSNMGAMQAAILQLSEEYPYGLDFQVSA